MDDLFDGSSMGKGSEVRKCRSCEEIKHHSVEEFDKKYRHTHSEEQIETCFREKCRLGLSEALFIE